HAKADQELGDLPDAEMAERDEELAARRLQEHEVEAAVADLLGQLAEIGEQQDLDIGLYHQEDAEQHQRLVERPAADRTGLAEHGVDHRQAGAEGDQRVEAVDQQVDAVFELELDRVGNEQPQQAEIAPHAPTAE